MPAGQLGARRARLYVDAEAYALVQAGRAGVRSTGGTGIGT